MTIKIGKVKLSISETNKALRFAAINFSAINLGRLCNIHQLRIYHWQIGLKELLVDDLQRVANILDIRMEVEGA